jgi:hypothetical protein
VLFQLSFHKRQTVNMKNFTMQYSSTSRFFISVLPLVLSLFVFLGNSSANTPVGVNTAVVLTGTTYYVSPSGNDINPGTMALPFATIQKAIATATSGDAIVVEAGTYNGPITVNKKLDINGAGIGATIVQATGGTAFTYMADASGSGPTDRAKLRNMTVEWIRKGPPRRPARELLYHRECKVRWLYHLWYSHQQYLRLYE